MARTPPLGWRSWNAFGNRINQSLIEAQVDALVERRWQVWGGTGKVSLADVGYSDAGIDEGWEGCGEGVNGTQHDAAGNPVINSKFPDMAGLVAYMHARNVSAGWYLNG